MTEKKTVQVSESIGATMSRARSDLMTANEAPGRWCFELRAQRVTQEGAFGKREAMTDGGNALVDPQGKVIREGMGCAGPSCAAWRWYRLYPGESAAGLAVASGGDAAVMVSPDRILQPDVQVAEPVGYCGRAGRPDASVPLLQPEESPIALPTNRAARRRG